ncbi:MAG: 50S ribosomal protein L11 methyltransferase [Alphaproteobacteria bacterium]|nr:50S ribosomal protein L11 methyltransferase [Alphaproteobacteria bacterium]
MSGWKLELVCPRADVEPFGAALDPFSVAIAAFEIVPGGSWRLEAYLDGAPDPADLEAALATVVARPPHFTVVPLPTVDWLSENRRDFPAQRFGRFELRGSHIDSPPPPSRIVLTIDAATAFGSGEHATTRGCLLLLERIAKRKRCRRPLDIGCGSGVLALAMARLWRKPVVAGDLDPESVRVARENARINAEAGRLTIVNAAGYRHRAIARRRPYDVVAANILARPLMRLAPALRRHLARGGYAVLSGLLVEQEAQVLSAHRAQRLALVTRLRDKGWSALLLRRR